MNAIMDTFVVHTTSAKQVLDAERVRTGLKSILLGPAALYESLRWGGGADGARP